MHGGAADKPACYFTLPVWMPGLPVVCDTLDGIRRVAIRPLRLRTVGIISVRATLVCLRRSVDAGTRSTARTRGTRRRTARRRTTIASLGEGEAGK